MACVTALPPGVAPTSYPAPFGLYSEMNVGSSGQRAEPDVGPPPGVHGAAASADMQAAVHRGCIRLRWQCQGSTADLTTAIEGALSELHADGWILCRLSQIRNYLLRHADLTPLLRRLCAAAKAVLGAEAQLALEAYEDAEFGDEYLRLSVRKTDYGNGLMKRIRAIREQYEDELAEHEGWLHLTTDFQPPREANGL